MPYSFKTQKQILSGLVKEFRKQSIVTDGRTEIRDILRRSVDATSGNNLQKGIPFVWT